MTEMKLENDCKQCVMLALKLEIVFNACIWNENEIVFNECIWNETWK